MLPDSTAKQLAIAEVCNQGWVTDVQWTDSTDSTNLAAKRALREEVTLPAVYVTDTQTAGRGRGDHGWWSPPGCLMLTLAIGEADAPASIQSQQLLGMVCGVAIAGVASSVVQKGSPVELKWPNDVYCCGRKLAGILIENQVDQSGRVVWLIGIGINVDVDWTDAPTELIENATCLSAITRRNVDRCEILVSLIQTLHRELRDLQSGSTKWFDDWINFCMLSGKVVRAQEGDHQFVGRCEGINRNGHLLIRDEKGIHELSSGEIVNWQ